MLKNVEKAFVSLYCKNNVVSSNRILFLLSDHQLGYATGGGDTASFFCVQVQDLISRAEGVAGYAPSPVMSWEVE